MDEAEKREKEQAEAKKDAIEAKRKKLMSPETASREKSKINKSKDASNILETVTGNNEKVTNEAHASNTEPKPESSVMLDKVEAKTDETSKTESLTSKTDKANNEKSKSEVIVSKKDGFETREEKSKSETRVKTDNNKAKENTGGEVDNQ